MEATMEVYGIFFCESWQNPSLARIYKDELKAEETCAICNLLMIPCDDAGEYVVVPLTIY